MSGLEAVYLALGAALGGYLGWWSRRKRLERRERNVVQAAKLLACPGCRLGIPRRRQVVPENRLADFTTNQRAYEHYWRQKFGADRHRVEPCTAGDS